MEDHGVYHVSLTDDSDSSINSDVTQTNRDCTIRLKRNKPTKF